MREIKFDAFILIKHPEDDEAHFEHLSFSELLHECFIVFKGGVLTTDEEDDDHKTILREYTGLKDKNDKEIYEGDIVTKDGDTRLFCIEYVGRGFAFLPQGLLGKGLSNTEIGLGSKFEVIGNIYENPEWLGEQK